MDRLISRKELDTFCVLVALNSAFESRPFIKCLSDVETLSHCKAMTYSEFGVRKKQWGL